MPVQSLSPEDPLGKEMVTCSSIRAWKIPWRKEPGGLVHRVAKSQTWLSACVHEHTHTEIIT